MVGWFPEDDADLQERLKYKMKECEVKDSLLSKYVEKFGKKELPKTLEEVVDAVYSICLSNIDKGLQLPYKDIKIDNVTRDIVILINPYLKNKGIVATTSYSDNANWIYVTVENFVEPSVKG